LVVAPEDLDRLRAAIQEPVWLIGALELGEKEVILQ
jgi:hypothetical protein